MLRVVGLVFLLSSSAFAASDVRDFEEEGGDARLGFFNVAADGTTSLTFNATSIQNAVVLGLFILVLGALVAPLFGLSADGILGAGSATGYGYDQYGSANSGYDASGYEYNTYSKRSLEAVGPVLDALSSAHKKYSEDEDSE